MISFVTFVTPFISHRDAIRYIAETKMALVIYIYRPIISFVLPYIGKPRRNCHSLIRMFSEVRQLSFYPTPVGYDPSLREGVTGHHIIVGARAVEVGPCGGRTTVEYITTLAVILYDVLTSEQVLYNS